MPLLILSFLSSFPCYITAFGSKIPKPLNFTIHGSWLSDSSLGMFDDNCHGKIDPVLQPELSLYWPNLVPAQPDKKFWAYEWTRHGSCSKAVISLLDYFKMTLKWKNQIDLFKAGFVPGPRKSYDPQLMLSEIHNVIKFKPLIRCPLPDTHKLAEIAVCVDKLGHNLIDCPTSFKSCPSTSVDFIM